MRDNYRHVSSAAALAIAMLFSNLGVAQTYYVSPDGANSRSRAVAQNPNTPWKTLRVAVARARPGSTIVVQDGNYWDVIDLNYSDVTIRAENRQGATLIGSIYAQDKNFIVIDGLKVTNRRLDAPRSKGTGF